MYKKQVASPEDARVSEAIRAAMKLRGLSGTELATRIEALTGRRPTYMSMSRRLNGGMHLTEVRKVGTTEPNDDLRLIAKALGSDDPEALARELAAHAAEENVTRGHEGE